MAGFQLSIYGGFWVSTEVLMADGCDYVTGETIVIDGGAFLGGGGGNFWQLSRLGDQDWESIRSTIKSANEKDKAQRTA